MRKKLLFTSLVFCILFLFGTASAYQQIMHSGVYGQDFSWTIDSDGVFTFSGSGRMSNSFEEFPTFTHPWDEYKSEIRTIIIEDGITSIEEGGFSGCSNLEKIVIADSVSYIGDAAFAGSQKLNTVYLGGGIKYLPYFAFGDCYIKDIYYSGNERDWDKLSENSYFNFENIHFTNEIISEGSFGNLFYWYLDDSGKLNISGTGYMPEWSGSSNQIPWYSNRDKIKKVVLESGVKSVGSWAFNDCPKLEEIVFSSNVESIGRAAFANCPSLNGAVIPDKVKEIKSGAFFKCTSLKNITFGKGISVIPEEMLYGCSSLKEISIPANVITVEDYAFYGCYSANSLTFLGKTEFIGVSAFEGCVSVTELIIPDSVTTIEPRAFSDCYSLNYVKVGNGIKEIKGIFTGSKNIETLVIGPNVGLIGEYEFAYNTILSEVTIENRLVTFERGVFYGCSNLKSLKFGNAENKIKGKNVIWSESVFNGCQSLESIIVPDGVHSLNSNVFSGCNSLNEITLPYSLMLAIYDTFNNCDYIEKIYYTGTEEEFNYLIKAVPTLQSQFPATAEFIYLYSKKAEGNIGNKIKWALDSTGRLVITGSGEMVFEDEYMTPWYDYKYEIKSLSVCPGITNIAGYAFDYCENLTKINLSSDIRSIGEYAFSSTRVKAVEMPKYLTEIGAYAFSYCVNLKEIYLNSELSAIGPGAFYSTALSEIYIPSRIKRIEDNTFRNCKSLVTVSGCDNVNSIGNYAFSGCAFTTFTIPPCCSYIGENAFEKCKKLTSVSLNENLTEIDDKAFSECGLLSFETGDYIETLGNNVFEKCMSLKFVSIGKKVNSIGTSVFSNCFNLESILVDEENKAYIIIDGILFSYDKTRLIKCPQKLKISSFVVPEETIYIENEAFFNSLTLKNISFGKNLKTIGENAFCESGLMEIVIPDSVTEIGNGVFSYCSALKNVTLGKNIEKIGEYAFYCSGIKSVTIPDKIKIIESGTFAECNYLTNAVLGKSVEEIKSSAFRMSRLTGINIPASVKSIENNAFTDCAYPFSLYIKDLSSWFGISLGYEYAGSVKVFYNGEQITSITVDDDISSINDCAFKGWQGLETVIFGDNVTNLGYSLFDGCHSLKKVVIGNGIKNLDTNDLGYCTIDELHLGFGIKRISFEFPIITIKKIVYSGTEKEWKKISNSSWISENTSVVFLNILRIIESGKCGNNLLWSLTNHGDMTISGTGDMYAYSYYYDENGEFTEPYYPDWNLLRNDISRVIIEEGVTSVGNYAFYNCQYIKGVNLPKSLISIGKYAFANCSILENIIIPENVSILKYGCFDGCGKLEKITIKALDIYPQKEIHFKTVYFHGTSEEWENIKGITADNVIFKEHTRTVVSEDKKSFCVNPVNVDPGKNVMIALYKNDKFVEVKMAIYKSEELLFETEKDYDSVKILVWDDINSLVPVTEAEECRM